MRTLRLLLLLSFVLIGCKGNSGTETATPAESTSAGWIKDSTHLDYLLALPTDRAAVYAQAKVKWNTGVTMDMQEGNSMVMDFLKQSFVGLAGTFADGSLGGLDATAYADSFVVRQGRTNMQSLMDQGMGGSSLGLMASNAVITDFEKEIATRVAAIPGITEEVNVTAWTAAWLANPQ